VASRTKPASAARPADDVASVPRLPKGARKTGYPGFVEPMLASTRSRPPAGAQWLHEIKFDGYRLVVAPSIVRYSEHFDEDGNRLFQHVCRLGLEGVISKVRNAPYRSGRSKDWIKAKCANRQEFVVAGYVPSTVSNTAIGSLVLGYYEDGKLIHVGRVGTGFSHKLAEDLFRRLDPMRIPKSPFAKKLSALEVRRARFVRPELVAEVEFRSWTNDRLIRHSSFLGVREDKLAKEVVAAAAIYWSYRRKRAGEVRRANRAIERVYREEDRAQERERRSA
jgi:ATP-dependent DNA ligase